jgi:O-antigen/teichoic acid export membrane protein
VLLFVANALASQSDPAQLAIYGLANQIIAMFFFLPTTVGGLAIPHLTLADAPTRRKVVKSVSLAMVLISAACAAGFVLATGLPFVPQLFDQGKFEIAVAFALAGLATARSPQVWVNQIERQSGNESAALLTNAALLATMLFISPITAMFALVVRTAAAAASLVVSHALARSTALQHDA